jgi:hypothetical protein
MRCKACGAELILCKVTPNDMVRGLEHHTLICSACHVTEHQLLLMRHGREDDTAVHADRALRSDQEYRQSRLPLRVYSAG